ncbi:hypothetical protein [Metasolibacillus sp.]|uniref:hypothetical protein n=1 Tax=Metasolibacillus sp. TaxID=2703680 RepID=UPI0025DC6210|nr:hypothetical protein [Metasolibacillus sp.]MCT6924090.1 hypothetical protein [Metasolibacillus sp.]MCT6940197.1 hypothetical protein [Metasolibacillus sp.]
MKVGKSVTDPITKITTQLEETLFTDKKCKLSYEKQTSTTPTGGPAIIAQTTKLFIAPELDIPAGSKIIVTQHGKTNEFTRSGKPAVFMDHQEIMLEAFERYA